MAAALDAYARRDIEALRASGDPDIALDWSASAGWMAGVYRGFAEVDRVWEGLWGAFEEIVIEPERYLVAGELVVVPNVSHQRGRDGIEVSAREPHSCSRFAIERSPGSAFIPLAMLLPLLPTLTSGWLS